VKTLFSYVSANVESIKYIEIQDCNS